MSTLQNDIRLYVRKARKQKGTLSFESFNEKLDTNLPIDENSLFHQQKFEKSVKLARKRRASNYCSVV